MCKRVTKKKHKNVPYGLPLLNGFGIRSKKIVISSNGLGYLFGKNCHPFEKNCHLFERLELSVQKRICRLFEQLKINFN